MQIKSVDISATYKLAGTLLTPDNINKEIPAVIFYHGMVSKSKPRTVERAKRVAEKGIAALAFDFRGCGESDGKLGEISLKNWLDDALLAFDYLANQGFVDKKRIGIAGKSFGGYMAAFVCQQRTVTSMVLHAPAVYPDSWFNKPYQPTNDIEHQRLMYRKSPEAFHNKAIRAIEKYKNPLLVVGSELDDTCPKHIVEGFYNLCPAKQKEMYWIKGADHPLTNEKHNEEYIMMMTKWFVRSLT